MSKPPEIDRKNLKAPDKFVKRGTQFFSSILSHRAGVSRLIVGIIAVVLLGYGYQWWQESKSDKAWKAYYSAGKEAEPQKWEALKKIANDFANTRPGFFAAVNLADHHFEEAKKSLVKDLNAIPQDASTAADWYFKALQNKEIITSERQLLEINRAGALEMQKKYDEALAALKLAEEKGGDLKGFALLNSARVLELKGEKEKAIEVYEKVSADHLNTEYAKVAKNYARRLKSPALMSFQ